MVVVRFGVGVCIEMERTNERTVNEGSEMDVEKRISRKKESNVEERGNEVSKRGG